jgi:hypothetical protein
LGKDTLARMVYGEQKRNKWPGLTDEVSRICSKSNIENANETNLSKNMFKNILDKACTKKREQEMKAGMEGKTKMERWRTANSSNI